MRYILYQSNTEQIPLEKELDYLKNYVELQKIRFDEDVDIRLNIAVIMKYVQKIVSLSSRPVILAEEEVTDRRGRKPLL